MPSATHRPNHLLDDHAIGTRNPRRTTLSQPLTALDDGLERANDISAINVHPTEHLTVGAISGPALSFVPRAIARIVREYPLLRLRLQVESSDCLFNALRAGRIDVMVGRLLEGYDASNFNYQRLRDEPMCAIAPKGHRLLKYKQVRMQDLASAPWIVPQPGSLLRYRFDLMFREAGCSSPTQIIEAVSQTVVTRLVEETAYLAILARDVAEHYASVGFVSVLPIELPCNLESFGLVTRKDWQPSRAARGLCEALNIEARANNLRKSETTGSRESRRSRSQ
jgi:DNA-binding transcriptional LysR family regulator